LTRELALAFTSSVLTGFGMTFAFLWSGNYL
jgi:hypothetical protein